MKFLRLKTIFVGSVLMSLFVGAVFASCHSMTIASTSDAGNSLALPITQSLNEPCCMVQGGNYSLHSLPLAAIISTATSQNSVPEVTGSPIGFQNAAIVSTYISQRLYFDSSAEVPLYSYLTNFIAQGLLQPRIYSTSHASA